MREIKFRGLDVDGKWVIGSHLKTGTGMHYIVPQNVIGSLPQYSVRAETVGQYTGLKDKNGVEIYEGDVLYHPIQGKRKVYYPFMEHVASFGLVNIENGMAGDLSNSQLYEIIGTVHENPELLEDAQ